MKGPASENLLASPIVERARALSRLEILSMMGVPLLLVAVESAASELARTLQSASAGAKTPLTPSIGFRTLSPVPGMSLAPRERTPLTAGQIEQRLARGPHVAIPLRKRYGAAKDFSDRISVGRAMNNDIVLRHERVSKFHAWFIRDEEENYYVADAASRNGTSLNGARVESVPTFVESGDIVRFGGVEAAVCTAEVLWEAVALVDRASVRPAT